jgi:signal transduction histidine kinase/CHASE3 domain sensor protein/FixJ family two-component response regulator
VKVLGTPYLAHFAFWFTTLLMISVVSWALYNDTTIERTSSGWVSHTHAVLDQLAAVNEELNVANSAQRNYMLSGSDDFLPKRDRSLERLNDAVARIREMTVDNPGQQERTSRLEKLIAARVLIIQQSSQLLRIGGIAVTPAVLASGVGQQASDKIFDVVAAMRHDELGLLLSREATVESIHKTALGILTVSVIISVIILIPGYLGFVLQARALKRTDRKLRVMADSLPGKMYQLRIDRQGNRGLTFLSARVKNVRGTNVGAQGALPDWNEMVSAIDERDRSGFIVALDAATRSGSPFSRDYRVRRGDGTLKWLHHEASVQKGDKGIILVNGYVSDISDKKQMQDALQEAKEAAVAANRAKSTFLATMSHEIRTPMNGMLGMLELLSLTKLDREQLSTLGIVRASSKSLLRAIDDILDFSKIEAGKLDIRPEVTSIKEVFEHVHDIYTGNASSKGLLMKRSVDPHISPAVLIDPLRLRQILNNFVSNSLKFTSQGWIEIRAELIERVNGEDRIRFSVQDTGVGIAPENQQHLFEPFAQVDDDRARSAGGTGLGLTICRRLAYLMGGSVEMVSELGKGTTMILTLTLPIADPSGLPTRSPESEREFLSTIPNMRRMAPSVEQAEAEGTLVLVVDDHPTNRTLLVRQAHALGYAAESAENGVQALEMWKSERFGLVITDCNMPEMDGFELARSIRRFEAVDGGKRTPIISCTANALGDECERCLAAGMDDCLVKPVALSQILKKLDQWLPIPPATAAPALRAAASDARQDVATAAPVDRSVLAGISGGNAEAERDILVDFRRTNDQDATMLERAVATSDFPQVRLATHRMLGASRMVGAFGFAGVCERIGHTSRADDATTIAADMAAFHQEWTRLNAYLDALR